MTVTCDSASNGSEKERRSLVYYVVFRSLASQSAVCYRPCLHDPTDGVEEPCVLLLVLAAWVAFSTRTAVVIHALISTLSYLYCKYHVLYIVAG